VKREAEERSAKKDFVTVKYLPYAGAFFAVVAAVLWFLSARVKTPSSFHIQVIAGGGLGGALGGGPVGGGRVLSATSQDLTDLAKALIWQSRLSSAAAICAGIAAPLGAAIACS
jgi:hypothetical protein